MPGFLFYISYLFLNFLQSRFFSSLKEFFLLTCFTGFGYILLIKKKIYI